MRNTTREIYLCYECQNGYTNKQAFIRHVLDKHNGNEYYDKYKDPIFENVITCKQCGRAFCSMPGLSRHIKNQHNPIEYFRTYIDVNAGYCKNPACNNKTTFRSIVYGSKDKKSYGIGFDPYCSNKCAHADPNSKFHLSDHGYCLRAITSEHTAQDILDKENYYERKRIKYLPENEWNLALKLKHSGVNFTWQKHFGQKNVDFYFPDENMVIELNEIAHYHDKAKARRDVIRKDYIMSLPGNENLKWKAIRTDGLDEDQIMEKVFYALYVYNELI